MSTKKNHPDYGTPDLVLKAIEPMRLIERLRAQNRALIDALMNGKRPYSDEEVEQNQIFINTNFGEGPKILTDATQQVNSALLHKGNFFTATCLKGPVEKREEWGQKFTININRILKRSLRYVFLLKNRNASLTLHGIGPIMWMNDFDWMGRFIPLEDLLIPTGTTQDFQNLTHFAANLYLTPYELMEMTHGEKVREGWDITLVRKILQALTEQNANPNNYNWYDKPEEMQAIWKQNRALYDTDSVPKVKLVAFFYRVVEDKKQKWFRKIVLRESPASTTMIDLNANEDFVYDSKNAFAEDINHILHVQFADYNVVPPLTYQATRGLGEMLYAVVELINRTRCQFAQHVLESMLMYLKIRNPLEHDRPKQLQLMQFGVIEDGVEIVPREQRHQIDAGLVNAAMSEYRQLLSESSSSFVQDIDSGTQKEMTLGEAQIRLQSVNKMVSGTLDTVYLLETFKDTEIVRRFLLPNSDDEDVKKFKEQCKADGIPDFLMKPEHWEINTDRVMGGGDQTLALQETTALFQAKQNFDPSSQRKIDRMWVTQVTRDPAKGIMLVPDEPLQATDGRLVAEDVFATLMRGIQVTLREGIEQEDYVSAMLQMMEVEIANIMQTDGVGTPQDVKGLVTVGTDTNKHIMLIAANEQKTQLAKQMSDQLGKLMNEVKGMATRQQQAAEKASEEGGQDPKVMAEIQAMLIKAQVAGEIKKMTADQKLKNDQLKMEAGELRKNIELIGTMDREQALQAQTLMFNRLNKMVELAGAAEKNGDSSDN